GAPDEPQVGWHGSEVPAVLAGPGRPGADDLQVDQSCAPTDVPADRIVATEGHIPDRDVVRRAAEVERLRRLVGPLNGDPRPLTGEHGAILLRADDRGGRERPRPEPEEDRRGAGARVVVGGGVDGRIVAALGADGNDPV